MPRTELVVEDELAVPAGVAAFFAPGLRPAEEMGRGAGKLGEIGHDARPYLVEIVNSGHADVTHVAQNEPSFLVMSSPPLRFNMVSSWFK